MGRLLVVVLGLATAQPERPAPTPAEQYRALVKEFSEAANANWRATTDEERRRAATRIEPLPLKLVELAEKHPHETCAIDALTAVITQEYWLDNYSSHAGWGKDSRQARAIAILLRDHLQSDQLAETCKRAQFGFRQECETFLRTVLEKNPHREVRANACLRLALFLIGRLNRLDLLTNQPELTRRYEGLYGKEYLDALRHQDRAQAVAEAEAMLERAAKEYGDVKMVAGTIGDSARTELFGLRHLTVGHEAPDIEGVDQDGARFKLSDYRGKVVLLYFWQQL